MTRHAERQAAYRARKLLADEEGYRTRDREAKGDRALVGDETPGTGDGA